MNAKEKGDPKKLVGEVLMLRIRVATAESKVKLLGEQNRQAKRRRKEAKQLAQRARKQFKRFKAGLADLQQSLAEAEVKLFQAGGRALARKTAKAKAVANRGARPSKESKTITRQPRVPRRVTSKKIAIPEAKVVSESPADVAALDPTAPTSQVPEPIP